ncbi:MAG: RNA ligase family protein [Aeromonas popoffii]|uniref:RNA ligase family protein n=1 Tax=Aeromonas popoffii TaxID=70856 RepID=UPI003F40CAA4
MEFTRFQSLLNENPKNSLGVLKKCADLPAVKTEKLHGANFSVYINSDKEYRFASRNQYMCRESNFFQFQRFFTEERMLKMVEAAQPFLDNGETIRVIGELFGGYDAVGIKPVQKEIRYDGDIQFRAFHVEFINKEGEIRHACWDEVVGYVADLGLELVPVVGEGTLQELYSEDIENPSVLASNGDIAEGYCYRLRSNHEGHATILKRRTTEFCETKGKKGGKLVETAYDPAILPLLNQVRDMVTAQRVSNVNSHHGFVGMPCFPHLHKAVMADIEKDAEADFGIDAFAFKIIRKDIGYLVNPLLKEELTK